MKKYYLLILISFCISIGKSQSLQYDIQAGHNWNYSGRSLFLGAGFAKKKLKLVLAVKVHQNQLVSPSIDPYRLGYRADNFKESIGLIIQPSYRLYDNESFTLSSFIDIQLAKMPLNQQYRAYYIGVKEFIDLDGVIYEAEAFLAEVSYRTKPYFYSETNIGLSLDLKIFKRFYLTQKLGVGALWVFDNKNKLDKQGLYKNIAFFYGLGFTIPINLPQTAE